MEVVDANQYRAHGTSLLHSAGNPLLRVSDLTIRFRVNDFRVNNQSESTVLKQISFAVPAGKIVGMLGESGCGKTTIALSIMRLLAPACMVSGSIQFREVNLRELDERQLRKIRGSEISIIYQDSNVLNPVMRVGDQVMEVLRAHKRSPVSQMREEIFALFGAIGLEDHDRIYQAYPHQLSGGQRRRITIAQALICKPRLVIADEPTSGLDSDTANEIVDVIAKLRNLYNTAFLLITHDPDTLAAVADEILVMYAGQIVESGPIREVFAQPRHPYTQALLQCSARAMPTEKMNGRKTALPFIPGHAPDPAESLPGCSFAERCRDRMPVCNSQPPELIEVSGTRSVRCFKYEEGA